MTVRATIGRVARLFGIPPNEVKRLRRELAAAHQREAELHVSIKQLAGQHRGAVEQHAAAAAQYEAANAQLAHAQEMLRGGPLQDTALGASIVISSLPKSGSIYQLNLFQKGLGYSTRNVSPGYFPHDQIDWSRLSEAASGGVVTQSHAAFARTLAVQESIS